MSARGGLRSAGKVVARACLAVLVLVGAPSLLTGQEPVTPVTPVTDLGLGYPVPSLDARAAALGGTGMGLFGGSFSSRNPADLALFNSPGIGGTLAPEAVTLKTADGNQSTGRSRYAVVQGVLPYQEWTFGFSINSELDQDWDIVLRDTLRTDFGDYPYSERRQNDGGISSIGLDLVRRFGPVAVGVEGSVVTGSLRQVLRRVFDPAVGDPSNEIGGATGDARWAFNGWRFRAGVTSELGRRLVLSAAVTAYTSLEAEKDTFGVAFPTIEFDMPVEFAGGGSAAITESLLLTVAGGWQGWSDTDVSLLGAESADVTWIGGGAEYIGFRLLGMPSPLRAGYRYTDLPFYEPGFEQLSEQAFTFGLGLRLAEGRAVLDFSGEIGSRGDLATTGTAEDFQRYSFSVGISTR